LHAEIRSIPHALSLLGERAMRKWPVAKGYIAFEYVRNLPQIEFTFIRRSQQFQVPDFVCRNATAFHHLRTAEEIVLKAAAGSLEQVWSTLCQWIPQAADYSVEQYLDLIEQQVATAGTLVDELFSPAPVR
jgi:hypothetical protein